jgi:hypothetical protein
MDIVADVSFYLFFWNLVVTQVSNVFVCDSKLYHFGDFLVTAFYVDI